MFWVLGVRFCVSRPDGSTEMRAGIGVSRLRRRRRRLSSHGSHLFYSPQTHARFNALGES